MTPLTARTASPSAVRGRAALRLLLPALLLCSAVSCRQITNPTADVELQQSLWDLEDLLVQMRDETALLQEQVDSLGGIVARQDTLLRQVAMRSGIPLP